MDLINLKGDPFKVFPEWSRSTTLCPPCIKRFEWKFDAYDHEAIQRGSKPSELLFTLSKDGLERSCAAGCPLCTISLQTLRLHEGINSLDVRYQLLNTNPQKDPTNLDLFRVTESWLDLQSEHHATSYDFWIHADPEKPGGTYFRTHDVNPFVSSQSAFKQAQSWITECIETHKDCKKPDMISLPSRVIDVTRCSSGLEPTLLITDGWRAPYAALSYCWGAEQPYSLSKSNLTRYVESIPIANLGKTIQDAITATLNLGLKYLWVDSLCIIQDSAEDKTKEISKMRQIFRHAHVTISAATASTAFDGFLQPRPAPVPSIRIPLRLPDGSKDVIYLYSEGEEPHMNFKKADHPVEYRAWTLEEKVLSQRVLVYSATHLRWLCDSEQFNDGGAQENFMDFEPALYRLPLKTREMGSHPSRNNVSSDSLHQSWRTLVAEFTRRSLTAPEDKLRAIAGLAEEYAVLMDDKYHAGLWESELVTELLWRRNSFSSSGKVQSRPKKYRAPSWSWASMNGEVALRSKGIAPLQFDIVGCSTTPVSPAAPFGELVFAVLKIRARTRPIWWDLTTETVFDTEGGISLGKGILDALDDEVVLSLAAVAVGVSENHGLLLRYQQDVESYQRVGWMYFGDSQFLDACEKETLSIY